MQGLVGIEHDVLGCRDAVLAIDGLGLGLVERDGTREHARECVGNAQQFKESLHAAILAIAPVERHEGDIIAAVGDGTHKVWGGHVQHVYLRESRLLERLCALLAACERYLALVRPPSAEQGHLAHGHVFHD